MTVATQRTLSTIPNIDFNHKAHRSIRGTRATGYSLNSTRMIAGDHHWMPSEKPIMPYEQSWPPLLGRSPALHHVMWRIMFVKLDTPVASRRGKQSAGVKCQRAKATSSAGYWCCSEVSGYSWCRVFGVVPAVSAITKRALTQTRDHRMTKGLPSVNIHGLFLFSWGFGFVSKSKECCAAKPLLKEFCRTNHPCNPNQL